MEYSTLKNTNLNVSRIGFGCCPMGAYGWGDVQESNLIDAVHLALDQGVNFFDTADTYGLGQSEQTLAKALGSNRDKVIISTKFGVVAGNGKTYYDNSPAYIRKACEASLKRLNTDYIDLYHIHYRDDVTPMEDVINTLDELRQKGYIRYYGLSNIFEEDKPGIEPFKGRFASFQYEYSLAVRKHEDSIKYYSQYMTPLTWGSLGQGILTGKYTKDVHFDSNDRRSRSVYKNFHGQKLLDNLEIVEVMRPIAEAHQKPLAAVAIRFILDYLDGSVAMCGIKKPEQLLANVEGADWSLSEEEIRILDTVSQGGEAYGK